MSMRLHLLHFWGWNILLFLLDNGACLVGHNMCIRDMYGGVTVVPFQLFVNRYVVYNTVVTVIYMCTVYYDNRLRRAKT